MVGTKKLKKVQGGSKATAFFDCECHAKIAVKQRMKRGADDHESI